VLTKSKAILSERLQAARYLLDEHNLAQKKHCYCEYILANSSAFISSFIATARFV
jgi:hypothetical protein